MFRRFTESAKPLRPSSSAWLRDAKRRARSRISHLAAATISVLVLVLECVAWALLRCAWLDGRVCPARARAHAFPFHPPRRPFEPNRRAAIRCPLKIAFLSFLFFWGFFFRRPLLDLHLRRATSYRSSAPADPSSSSLIPLTRPSDAHPLLTSPTPHPIQPTPPYLSLSPTPLS